jgi:hypothetical protein
LESALGEPVDMPTAIADAARVRANVDALIHEMQNQGPDAKARPAEALEEYAGRLERAIGAPFPMDAQTAAKIEITRIRHELENPDRDLVTLGVYRRDQVLADRLAKALKALA